MQIRCSFLQHNNFLRRSDPLACQVALTTDKLISKIGVRFLQSEFSNENVDESDINNEPRLILLDGIHASRLIHGVLKNEAFLLGEFTVRYKKDEYEFSS